MRLVMILGIWIFTRILGASWSSLPTVLDGAKCTSSNNIIGTCVTPDSQGLSSECHNVHGFLLVGGNLCPNTNVCPIGFVC
jgi:hypothetical protein